MASVGKLRLVSALHAGSPTRFEPLVDEQGQVEYENAGDLLDQHDGTTREALDSLAQRELLNKEYTTKVYICPSCQTEGMQYITACPHCESTHSVSTSFFEHETCGYTDQTTRFEADEETYYCPGCDSEVDSTELTLTEQTHLCVDCDEPFSTPEHRLWCRECRHLHPPSDAAERTLYEYTLSEEGEQWRTTQTDAREILAGELESRGFDVDIDTAVSSSESEAYPVHLSARDELLDHGLVIDIHSMVDSQKLAYIAAAAQDTGGRPTLLTTAGRVSDDILQEADRHRVMVLSVEEDGSLTRLDPVDVDRHSESSIMDRLTSAVDTASWKNPQ